MIQTSDNMRHTTNSTSTLALDSNVTSSFHESLNSTYRTEELLSPAGHYAMGAFLAAIALVGMIQNSSTLLALNKRQSPQRIEVLIKVLLATDFLVCVMSLPFAVTSSFANRWLFGSVGCDWYGFSMFFLGVFSINILTSICIERYMTVRQIMQVRAGGKTRLLIISLVVSSLWALVWCTLPLLGVSSYQLEGVGTSCSVDWKSKKPLDQAYFIVIIICCFILPLIIITACYSAIYRQVSSRPWSEAMMKQGHRSRRRIKLELHLAKTIFLASGSFALAWGPYAVISLLAVFTDPDAIPPIVFSIPALFAKCSVFGNSLVYVFMNRELRHTCLETICLKKYEVQDNNALEVPNGQGLHVAPCVRLEPREACPERGHTGGSPMVVSRNDPPPRVIQVSGGSLATVMI